MRKREKMIFRRCYSELISDNLNDLEKGIITIEEFKSVIKAFLTMVDYGFSDIFQNEYLQRAEELPKKQGLVLKAIKNLIEDDKKDYSKICY